MRAERWGRRSGSGKKRGKRVNPRKHRKNESRVWFLAFMELAHWARSSDLLGANEEKKVCRLTDQMKISTTEFVYSAFDVMYLTQFVRCRLYERCPD